MITNLTAVPLLVLLIDNCPLIDKALPCIAVRLLANVVACWSKPLPLSITAKRKPPTSSCSIKMDTRLACPDWQAFEHSFDCLFLNPFVSRPVRTVGTINGFLIGIFQGYIVFGTISPIEFKALRHPSVLQFTLQILLQG